MQLRPLRTPRIPSVCVLLTFSLMLFVVGCTSTRPQGPSDVNGSLTATNTPSAQAPHVPTNTPTNQPPTQLEPSAPTPPPTPKPITAKPWSIQYKQGHPIATVDGVLLYLLEATKQNKATPLDHKKSISPLIHATGKPIVTGRPMRVFIDPGHGGNDPGATSNDRTISESKITLQIAQKLATYLKQSGFEVRLSREEPTRAPHLEERVYLAKRWKADLFVSIHINAMPQVNSRASGLETFVLTPAGAASTNPSQSTPTSAYPGNANDIRNLQLGFAIQRRTLKTSRLNDRGLRRARFIVLREATMPAALIECGFINSTKDRTAFNTTEGRERLARGIFQGICDYAFGTLAPGLPAFTPGHVHEAFKAPESALAQSLKVAPTTATTNTLSWTPPQYAPDPHEDSRIQRIREETARAAGLLSPSTTY